MVTKIDEELIRNLSHFPIRGNRRHRVVFKIDGQFYSPYEHPDIFHILKYQIIENYISLGHREWNKENQTYEIKWDEPKQGEIVGYIPYFQDLMVYLIKKAIDPADLRYDMMAPSVLDQRDYVKKQIIAYIRKK